MPPHFLRLVEVDRRIVASTTMRMKLMRHIVTNNMFILNMIAIILMCMRKRVIIMQSIVAKLILSILTAMRGIANALMSMRNITTLHMSTNMLMKLMLALTTTHPRLTTMVITIIMARALLSVSSRPRRLV